MELAILLTCFLGGLVIGLPVAVTLGVSSLAYLSFKGMPLVVIPQKMYAGMDSFVLLCIPGFILAGNLMNGGGITGRIIRFAQAMEMEARLADGEPLTRDQERWLEGYRQTPEYAAHKAVMDDLGKGISG